MASEQRVRDGEITVEMGKSYPSLDEMVEVFKTYGVRVWYYVEGENDNSEATHLIRFWGGDSAGMKAVSIAINHGFQIEYLKRAWYFWDNNRLQGNGSWEMTVFVNDVQLAGFNGNH